MPAADLVLVCCGGGGLLAGVATAVKLSRPECQVLGVEPVTADTMARSLRAGAAVSRGEPRLGQEYCCRSSATLCWGECLQVIIII